MTQDKINSYIEKAESLREQGFSCSQCVLMALSELLSIDQQTAMRLASAYGAGFAATGGMCGALSILGAAQGMVSDIKVAADKAKAMADTRKLYDRFKTENQERTLCCELKGKPGSRSCHDLIVQAVRIFLEENSQL